MTSAKSRQARARLAWISSKGVSSPQLAASLTLKGFSLVSPIEPAELALVDVRHHPRPANQVRRFARLYQTPSYGGRIILASPTLPSEERAALRRLGDVVYDVSRGQENTTAVTKRNKYISGAIQSRLRLAAIAEEAGERLKTCASFNAALKVTPTEDEPSILLAGAPGPDMLSAMNALDRHRTAVTAVFAAPQILRAIEVKDFDAAVFLPPAHDTDETCPLISLAGALARHLMHRRTPIIMPVDDNSTETDEKRSLGTLGVIPLHSAHLDEDLASISIEAANRARAHRALRDLLSKTARQENWLKGEDKQSAKDLSTGFFAVHANRLLQRAGQTGRPISLIGVAAQSSKSADAPQPALRAAFAKTLELAANVVRDEDLKIHVAPDMFVVLAPATRQEDAGQIADRLEAFISSISPRQPDHMVMSAAIQCDTNYRIEENLSQLMRDLRPTRRPYDAVQRR